MALQNTLPELLLTQRYSTETNNPVDIKLPRRIGVDLYCYAVMTMVLCLTLCFSLPAVAAVQGEEGQTSTAKINITLIIPPKLSDLDVEQNNPEALARVCQLSVEATQKLHQIYLTGQDEVTTIIHCRHINNDAQESGQTKTATVLIEPL